MLMEHDTLIRIILNSLKSQDLGHRSKQTMYSANSAGGTKLERGMKHSKASTNLSRQQETILTGIFTICLTNT